MALSGNMSRRTIGIIIYLCCCLRESVAGIFQEDPSVGKLQFGKSPLDCRLGRTMTSENAAKAEYLKLDDGFRVTWPGSAYVSITNSDIPSAYDVTCQDVTWMAEDCRVTAFEDCYSLGGAHWYGGAAIRRMTWPIETWDREMRPFVSGDAIGPDGGSNSAFSGVLERYWLSSEGVAIYVNSEVPLWISVNDTGDQELCLRSTYEKSPYINHDNTPLFFNYTICQGADVKEMHRFAMENFFDRPLDIPDEILFRYPIYSTWARYHENVTQAKVIEYANEVIRYNYSIAQLQIDDDWESSYGQLDFDPEKFPDPAAMVAELGDLGVPTTVWVHPFVSVVPENDWLQALPDPGGVLPALTLWWNGVASTVDFTDPENVRIWSDKLAALRDNYGVTSYKFDAGEAYYLPAAYRPEVPFRNPCDYSTRYAEAAHLADADVRRQEARVGYRTQRLPMFVRLLDKYSRWSHDNGLRSVIPHVLLFGLIGYAFPLPDMVGGNAYAGRFPDRELFVRWTELNALLPGFQFSIVPWQFDDDVVAICRRMLDVREAYADLMIELARNATQSGEPIVRPLWWIAPDDPVALETDSEFLVGDGLLVAPVLQEGATSRDIYLPEGRWRDMNDPETILEGGRWIYDYSAPLSVLPYFTKLL